MYGNEGITNQRFTWTWDFMADDLIAACQVKIRHHEARISFWNNELADAETKADPDVRKQRSVAMGYNNSNTQRYREGRVEECEQALQNAETQLADFRHWLKMFECEPSARFQLTESDADYFGL